jgi:hypothetical protein
LIENNSFEDLIKIYDVICELSLINILPPNVQLPDSTQIILSKINFLNIQDSIIIWTDSDSIRDFTTILLTVRNLLINSMNIGIPIRGGLSLVPVHYSEKKIASDTSWQKFSLIGKGVLKAYMLESKQNWSGCAIDSLCLKRFNDLYTEADTDRIDLRIMQDSQLLREYKIPSKKSQVRDEWAINWANKLRTEDGDASILTNYIRHQFSKFNKDCNNWEVEEKIMNTINFAIEVNKINTI